MTEAERLEAIGEARGKAEGKREGKAEGKAQAVLAFLGARGIPVTDEVRDRVMQCADLSVLDRWIARAVTCEHAEDLFSEA